MSEVDEQAYIHVAGRQIVDELPFVFWAQIYNGFQFDDDFVFDNHVWYVVANHLVFIIYVDWFLALALHPLSCQFFIERITIDCLEKSESQMAVHFLSRAND